MAENSATLPELVGTPKRGTFNGQELVFYPFQVDDFGAWDAWARADFRRSSREEAGMIADANERWGQESRVIEASTRISFGSVRGSGAMNSVGGKLHAVWLSRRHHNDKITKADVQKEIMGEKFTTASFVDLDRAMNLVMIASGVAEEDPEPSDPTKPA
jgi:hypothetical protein